MTILKKRDIKEKMRCSGQVAGIIEDTFVTVKDLLDEVESDRDLTEIDGIGPKTEDVIDSWYENRFEREKQADSGKVERHSKSSMSIYKIYSWKEELGMGVDDG